MRRRRPRSPAAHQAPALRNDRRATLDPANRRRRHERHQPHHRSRPRRPHRLHREAETRMGVARHSSRVPAWRIGMAVAISLWLFAFAFYCAIDSGWFPHSIARLAFVRTFNGYCGIAAAPIPLLGWMYVWGDMGPPWVEYPIFNIGFGILSYGLVGALIGYVFGFIRTRQFSLRDMLVVVTLLAVVLALMAAVLSLFRNSRPPWARTTGEN